MTLKSAKGLRQSQLKSVRPMRKKGRLNKNGKTSISQLKKDADDLFSTYVVYRDGQKRADGWHSQCITCDKWIKLVYKKDGTIDRRPIHWGHFQSSRHNITRYHPENVNAQCSFCNVRNQGEQYKYSHALDFKYGDGTAAKLAQLSKELHPFTAEELQGIISETREELDKYINLS